MRLVIGAAVCVFAAGYLWLFVGEAVSVWFIATDMIVWIVYELEAIRKRKAAIIPRSNRFMHTASTLLRA